MITTIYEDLATCWMKLAPHLDIDSTQCGIIHGNENLIEEKARRLCLRWKQAEGSKATVGRLVDALEKIGKKIVAEKLLAKVILKVIFSRLSNFFKLISSSPLSSPLSSYHPIPSQFRLFTALYFLVFHSLNARIESRENWTPVQNGEGNE